MIIPNYVDILEGFFIWWDGGDCTMRFHYVSCETNKLVLTMTFYLN